MATIDGHLGTAPLWLVGMAFLAALVGAALAGRWLRLRDGGDPGREPADSYLLTSALALLGLLIAFTFSLAVSRFDDRREAVIREGNAIGTAWLRAGLVEGPAGAGLQRAIRDYADIRLRLPGAVDPNLVEARSSAAQAGVWARMRAALPAVPAPLAATIVNAVNEMFDAASSRKAERDARIPGRVLDVVSLYAIVSAGIVGYVTARRGDRRSVVESIVLFILLTLAVTLIIDLDRPWSGAIMVSGQPLIDARAAMD